MSDRRTLDAIETAELIIQVDTGRDPADLFKLTPALLALGTPRLATAKARNAAATFITGATLGASGQRNEALARLQELERNGFNFIGSVASDDLSDAERLHVYTAYGWAGGKIGDFDVARVESLANLAISATADPDVPTAGKYPASLVTRITNWLAIYDASSLLATGGDRQTLIQQRNEARDQLEDFNSRVRLFYCSASDDGERTTELAKINMQPKRLPGDAQPQPLPDAPGAATFNAATRELTIPAMPAHTSFLRAKRQPAGGTVTDAGVSTDTTVSVVGIAPLTPGVSYQVWLVGVNSRGEGPESNKITFVA